VSSRESHVVELVTPEGSPAGSMTVDSAHQAPGRLHRAFSVFLRDAASGRVLVQQRAAAKTRFPLRWANSCCGHPLPGEDVAVAAGRRLAEELGVRDVVLSEVGVYLYRAEDPVTGRVEHEYDHVLLGDLPSGFPLLPDPSEVADLEWVSVPALLGALTRDPDRHAPWLAGVTGRLADHLGARPEAGLHSDAPRASGENVRQEPERSGGR
jgi:isopentenyl-diphosphate Delta-isomerase